MLTSLANKIRNRLRSWWYFSRTVTDYRLVRGPLQYNQDGLASVHACSFIHDPRFSRAYAKGEATGSWGGADVHWRAFIACWAAEWAARLDGDFVECGVNRGGIARSVIEFVEFSHLSKRFYLLDTYQGLVEKYMSSEELLAGRKAGGYEDCYEAVCRTFAPFQNVRIVRGPVPETLGDVDSDRIAFLSIDMNCVIPEIAAAEHFWEKMTPGGVIVLDDYGWPGHEPQKIGFDKFAEQRGVRVLALPTGQGLIFRPK